MNVDGTLNVATLDGDNMASSVYRWVRRSRSRRLEASAGLKPRRHNCRRDRRG
jgi:hypothetical protein